MRSVRLLTISQHYDKLIVVAVVQRGKYPYKLHCTCRNIFGLLLLQIRVAEQEGIVFIDEIDKIVNPSGMLRHGE